ncbi:MAG: hypothetical protein K0Q55_208 [Verrucomicrobia bacterium]|jgi:hypothetical protein|nr:hypothetical protein [Verrucomicrobiota bacterium]
MLVAGVYWVGGGGSLGLGPAGTGPYPGSGRDAGGTVRRMRALRGIGEIEDENDDEDD